jgi:Family of unknown function (DUF6526)
MQEQNFKNHTRVVPLFHGLTFLLVLIGLIGSVINFIRAYNNGGGRLTAALLILLFVTASLLVWFTRSFGVGVQDRAIRAEENLRYFSITGKLLDSRLSLRQIIALRFAPDEELIALAALAVKEDLKPTAIKQAIKQWKADHHRI